MNIGENILYIIAFMIAVVFHEYAHGYAALKQGDPTAKYSGRLTLNPLAHIDILGLISMVIFRIGWAKGVPVNPNNFKNKRKSNLIVSSAGILTNFTIATLASIFIRILFASNIQGSNLLYYLSYFLFILVWVNVMLGVFNLMPLPPLDGSKILVSVLPESVGSFFIRYERYFYIILLVLIFTGNLSRIISPIINFILNILL